jgi:hypothetical protein
MTSPVNVPSAKNVRLLNSVIPSLTIIKIEVKSKILSEIHGTKKPGLGPNNQNTQKNSLISCQIFILLKLLSNIYT